MDEMILKILNMIPNCNFDKTFVESVINRLTSFGYPPKDVDLWEISFIMLDIENRIKNSCNTTSVPEGLHCVAVDMICGQFLMNRKNTGRLELSDLDLSGAITSITEGDVSISFDASSTDEQRFNQLVNYLMTKGEGDFVCYRKLKW